MSEGEKELPFGWQQITLKDIGVWGSGGTPKRSNPSFYGNEIPWVKIGDMDDGPLFETEVSITKLGLENSSAKLLEPDTLLIAMYGSIGKSGHNKN